MGIPDECLPEKPPSSVFNCGICLELSAGPIITSCCTTVFCGVCIKACERERCPNCRGTPWPKDLSTNTFARRQYGEIKVRCPNRGCEWLGSASLWDSHKSQCEQLVLCQFGCGRRVARDDAEGEHAIAAACSAQCDEIRCLRKSLAQQTHLLDIREAQLSEARSQADAFKMALAQHKDLEQKKRPRPSSCDDVAKCSVTGHPIAACCVMMGAGMPVAHRYCPRDAAEESSHIPLSDNDDPRERVKFAKRDASRRVPRRQEGPVHAGRRMCRRQEDPVHAPVALRPTPRVAHSTSNGDIRAPSRRGEGRSYDKRGSGGETGQAEFDDRARPKKRTNNQRSTSRAANFEPSFEFDDFDDAPAPSGWEGEGALQPHGRTCSESDHLDSVRGTKKLYRHDLGYSMNSDILDCSEETSRGESPPYIEAVSQPGAGHASRRPGQDLHDTPRAHRARSWTPRCPASASLPGPTRASTGSREPRAGAVHRGQKGPHPDEEPGSEGGVLSVPGQARRARKEYGVEGLPCCAASLCVFT